MKDQLTDYKYIDDQKVVQDGHLITSRGPATAFDFALKIAENLVGAEAAQKTAQGMLLVWRNLKKGSSPQNSRVYS